MISDFVWTYNYMLGLYKIKNHRLNVNTNIGGRGGLNTLPVVLALTVPDRFPGKCAAP